MPNNLLQVEHYGFTRHPARIQLGNSSESSYPARRPAVGGSARGGRQPAEEAEGALEGADRAVRIATKEPQQGIVGNNATVVY